MPAHVFCAVAITAITAKAHSDFADISTPFTGS
jgi:hypothetical protein